jgi:twinkle protein|tara:strand:- start:1195 stop:2928 length:1734 start_codon:yes stop_codon:yes gene_type:complete
MSSLKIIGNTLCPECAKTGGDRTSNHLLILENEEGERFAKCSRSACGHYVPPKEYDPELYKAKAVVTKTPEQAQSEIAEVLECPYRELTARKIKQHVAERFGVRVGLDNYRASDIVQYFTPKTKAGELIGFKVRNLEPKFFFNLGHKGSDTELFGLAQAQLSDTGNKYLWIVEDELSAMSAYQALDECSTAKMKPSVVSLSDGTGSATKQIGEALDWINTFGTVAICMDSDEAGEKATAAILALVPHAQVVYLPPLKDKQVGVDANDYLMAGKSQQLFNMLFFKQEAPKVEGNVSVLDCLEEALEKPEYGSDYPWPKLTELTFGQRVGEIVGVGGGVGCGKTLLAHEIAAHNWAAHKEPSMMIMLEESNGDTVKNVCGKIDDKPYHRPDFDFDVEQLRATATEINEGIFLWKSNINQNIRFNVEKITSAIRYNAAVHGVKHVFFDNVTAATQHLTPTEVNTEVGRIAQTLAGLADELGLQIFIFSHLNTPSGGASHEEGGQVREFQFTGSRALMRWCQVIIGFERNKQAEGEEKHRSKIRLLKHRKYGTTGEVSTVYDTTTGRLNQYIQKATSNEEF